MYALYMLNSLHVSPVYINFRSMYYPQTYNFSYKQTQILYIFNIPVPDTTSYIRGWIQMVLAPNDLFSWNNKYNKYNKYNVTDTFTCFFLGYAHQLTLCMLASWSHEGVVFLDFLSSSHSDTSFLFPYLGSTDAPCSRLGDLAPPSPKWRPHSQGPRTLPYRDPEQYPLHFFPHIIHKFHSMYYHHTLNFIQLI